MVFTTARNQLTFTTPKVEKNAKGDSESDTHKDKVYLYRGNLTKT